MAFAITGTVGEQQLSAGQSNNPIRQDKFGSTVVQESNGKYAEACRVGRLWTASIPAAGVAIPIYTSTTQQCVFYNPVSSTNAMWLRKIYVGYVSGTMVAGCFVYAVQTAQANAISGTLTGSFYTNNKLTGSVGGAGVPNGTQALLYTVATVTAFTFFRNMGYSQVAQTAAGTNAPWVQIDDLDGSIILMPGAAIAVAANVAAAVTANVSFEYVEAPATLAVAP